MTEVSGIVLGRYQNRLAILFLVVVVDRATYVKRLTRKPVGAVGAVFRFTDQSMNVAVPRMAKTMVSI